MSLWRKTTLLHLPRSREWHNVHATRCEALQATRGQILLFSALPQLDILQLQRVRRRAFHSQTRAKRAARKLGLTSPEDVYTMERPKGMHKRTFQRLRQDVIDAIEREHKAFGSVVRKFASSL